MYGDEEKIEVEKRPVGIYKKGLEQQNFQSNDIHAICPFTEEGSELVAVNGNTRPCILAISCWALHIQIERKSTWTNITIQHKLCYSSMTNKMRSQINHVACSQNSLMGHPHFIYSCDLYECDTNPGIELQSCSCSLFKCIDYFSHSNERATWHTGIYTIRERTLTNTVPGAVEAEFSYSFTCSCRIASSVSACCSLDRSSSESCNHPTNFSLTSRVLLLISA